MFNNVLSVWKDKIYQVFLISKFNISKGLSYVPNIKEVYQIACLNIPRKALENRGIHSLLNGVVPLTHFLSFQ